MNCPTCGGKLLLYGTVRNSEDSIFGLIFRCQNCGDASIKKPSSQKALLQKIKNASK